MAAGVLLPQPGERVCGADGRGRRLHPLRRGDRVGRNVAPRPALLRLLGEGPHRSDLEPVGSAGHPGGRTEAPRNTAVCRGSAQAVRAGHGRRLLVCRSGALVRLRAVDGGVGGDRATRRGRLPRGSLRALPRLPGLQAAHADRRRPRRGLRGVCRRLAPSPGALERPGDLSTKAV